jgi:cytochrome c peroxidase
LTNLIVYVRADYVLTQDKSFKKYAKAYADSEEIWFKDFSSAVSRLFELGVPPEQFVTPEPWVMPTVDEQKTAKEKN